jgi:hypothetical protein
MIKPSVKVGSTNSTVSYTEKNFVFLGDWDWKIDEAGSPFHAGISTKGFH